MHNKINTTEPNLKNRGLTVTHNLVF